MSSPSSQSPLHIHRRTLLRGAVALAGLGTVGALSACGDDVAPSAASDPTSSEARKQLSGTVVVYSSTTEAVLAKAHAAFTKSTGLQVQLLRLTSGPLAQRFEQEATAGNELADTISLAEPAFYKKAAESGWLADFGEIPGLEKFPKEDVFDNKYFRVTTSPLTISYNTNLVPESDVPATWEEVLDPKFKGKILMLDPRGSAATLTWGLAMLNEYGEEFLTRLGKQQPGLAASGTPAAQALAAGEASLVVPSLHASLQPLLAQNAPVAAVQAPDVTTGVESMIGMAAKAPNPELAKAYLEFVASVEGQELFNEGTGFSSLGDDVEGALPKPAKYVPYDTAAATARRSEILGLLGLGG